MVWAVYSVILTKISDKYNYIYITRKIFFYGVICLIPLGFIFKINFSFNEILVPKYFLNLLFLSVIASALCFIMWNSAVSLLGPVKSSNYIYMVPLITAVTAVIVLNEPITRVVIIGAVLILLGLYISQNGFRIRRKSKK